MKLEELVLKIDEIQILPEHQCLNIHECSTLRATYEAVNECPTRNNGNNPLCAHSFDISRTLSGEMHLKANNNYQEDKKALLGKAAFYCLSETKTQWEIWGGTNQLVDNIIAYKKRPHEGTRNLQSPKGCPENIDRWISILCESKDKSIQEKLALISLKNWLRVKLIEIRRQMLIEMKAKL